MQLHFATYSHIPEIVALLDSAYRGEGSKAGWTSEADLFLGTKRTDENEVSELMQKPGAVFLICKNDEEKITGSVFLHKTDKGLYLGMLAVDPQTQGTGTGKLLLKAADDYAKKTGCDKIYMTVITLRQELIAWYIRHGYKNSGRTVPFPVDERFGIPQVKLEMVVLEKNIQ